MVNVTNIDLIKEEMSPFQKTSIKHSLGKKLQRSSQEHQFSSLAGRNKEARCSVDSYGNCQWIPQMVETMGSKERPIQMLHKTPYNHTNMIFHIYLRILCTITGTSAQCERSISVLKRLELILVHQKTTYKCIDCLLRLRHR